MKRCLIDTHALLWAADETGRLGTKAAGILGGDEAIVHVSIGTFWELAIKQSIGKLQIADDFFDLVMASGYVLLPIELTHIAHCRALPLHHPDPFDRLLIAQAQVEELAIITQDAAFGRYQVEVIWS